jgi:hypothetical protein
MRLIPPHNSGRSVTMRYIDQIGSVVVNRAADNRATRHAGCRIVWLSGIAKVHSAVQIALIRLAERIVFIAVFQSFVAPRTLPSASLPQQGNLPL